MPACIQFQRRPVEAVRVLDHRMVDYRVEAVWRRIRQPIPPRRLHKMFSALQSQGLLKHRAEVRVHRSRPADIHERIRAPAGI